MRREHRGARPSAGRTAAASLLLLTALLAASAPLVSRYSPWTLDWDHLATPPSIGQGHWFGTDRLGRDLYVRTMLAVRLSFVIGLVSGVLSVAIGVIWGTAAALAGGKVDSLLMRIVDVLYSLPYLFLVIILTTLFGRGNLAVLLLAIAAVGWLTTARIVRGQTLALRHQPFMEAARALGASRAHLVIRHVVPNIARPVLAYAILTVPQMILFESFLSFLGLGVQEPGASLGSLLSAGAQEIESAPWMLIAPAAFLVTLLLCLNALGDTLRVGHDRERS